MPALHQDKSRAEKAANQQAGKPVTARVAIDNVLPFPPNGAAAPSNADRQQNITTTELLKWLKAVMADHRLGSSAKVVAYCIMEHLNRETGHAFVSDATIADETRIGIRWVRMARNQLRAAGWIAWKRTKTASVYSTLTGPMAAVAEHQQELKQQRKEKRMQKRHDRQRSAEHADSSPPWEDDGDRQPSATHDRQPSAEQDRHPSADIPCSVNLVDEPCSQEDTATTDSDFKIAASNNHSGSNSDFEIWWQQYPRRVAKLRAEKAYRAALKSGATAAELLAGAGRYAAERAGQDPKFTKYPATWLNGGCWMDEPEPPKQGGNSSIMDSIRKFVESRNGK